MAVVEANKALAILMALDVLATVFAYLASITMALHVFPLSECLLFSSQIGEKLFYGHSASCNVVAYVFIVVALLLKFHFVKCWLEKRRRAGHAKAGHYEDQNVPKPILFVHVSATVLTLLLTIMTTTGYISACNNLHEAVSRNIQSKLNANPYETRGEEILTRYEDDYKFHRYTNRHGNAFGSEFYTIRITCRSILTDPDTHQKLHDTHYERQSRYYGYWYRLDLYAYDAQYEATKTNALVEASMAGSWLCFGVLVVGLIVVVGQRCALRQRSEEAERMSVHSTMMGSMHRGDGYDVGSTMMSVRSSNFQRGGSRCSDRSIKSTRRDIDDIALSMHHLPGSQNLLAGAQPAPSAYMEDMVSRNVATRYSSEQPHGLMILANDPVPSHYSSRETGYNSGYGSHNNIRYVNADRDSTILHRDEVETEIF